MTHVRPHFTEEQGLQFRNITQASIEQAIAGKVADNELYKLVCKKYAAFVLIADELVDEPSV